MSKLFPVILQFHKQSVNAPDGGLTAHYQVQVVRAPGQGWGGPMLTTGLDANQIRALRAAYRGFLVRQQARGEVAGEWTSFPLQQLGDELFTALPESVQARLQQAQGYAVARGGHLQITLLFDPSATGLLDLPWELLHDPHGRFFYTLRGEGITRNLLLPTAPQTGAPLLPKATLGCWAEPAGLEALAERRRFAPAPGHAGGFTWLQGPDSLGQVQRALETGAYDSLHLVAHGRTGSAWDFAIALEDGYGRAHWFGPQQLSLLLSHYPAIRFVYLDVCAAGDNQAIGLAVEEADAMPPTAAPGGAAGQLLGAGVTAVVMMQDRISQAAAGQMAERFYQELAEGHTVAAAMTAARRAVQLQQGDVIHWSVPALYRQQPTPQTTSKLADWVLDKVATPPVLGGLFAGLALAVLVGHLSFKLGQTRLNVLSEWVRLPPLLAACALLPLLAAVMTRAGQNQLAEKYGYHGRSWLPFLWHKYFSAFVWAMMAWWLLWFIWWGIYASGLAPGPAARQVLWAAGLTGVALAAHIGARQAIRQDLLFRRVGFSLYHGGLVDALLLLFLLLAPPFLPLLAWLLWQSVWQSV